jgi:putative transposase
MAGADRMTIEEVVKQVLLDEHGDVVREVVMAVCAELMEAEVSQPVGAKRGERRRDDRMTHRNGYRPREWQTRAATVELQIPELRRGSYFPRLLEARRVGLRRAGTGQATTRVIAAAARSTSASVVDQFENEIRITA